MAVFKVGQRVRKVASMHKRDFSLIDPKSPVRVPLGALGTVMRLRDDGAYSVAFDNYKGIAGDTGWFRQMDYCLAPLTDPKADEFIERLKKLGKEPRIVRDPVHFGG